MKIDNSKLKVGDKIVVRTYNNFVYDHHSKPTITIHDDVITKITSSSVYLQSQKKGVRINNP